MNAPADMPDVAKDANPINQETLDWVGMSHISLPINIAQPNGKLQPVLANLDIHVDIANPDVKGIHMSRLYLLLNRFASEQNVTSEALLSLLDQVCESHQGISQSAILRLGFDYPLNRPALKSDYSGWKPYPCTLEASRIDEQYSLEISVSVPYSSTCPCSAALSRQLLQEAFKEDFASQRNITTEMVETWLRSERGSVATPHSQRSYARVKVKIDAHAHQILPIINLIDTIEDALKTPVQTAVKREDEQEFARLNGANMMFCEDAARRLKSAFNLDERCLDFWIRVEHHESLHDHDAVAVVSKGIPGGYTPLLHR